jgi:hypothetical protein
MVFLAVLLAKFLDPIAAILGLAAGVFSRAWWQVAVAALAVAALVEFILSAMQVTRVFDLVIYTLGVVAVAAWAAIGRGAKSLVQNR